MRTVPLLRFSGLVGQLVAVTARPRLLVTVAVSSPVITLWPVFWKLTKTTGQVTIMKSAHAQKRVVRCSSFVSIIGRTRSGAGQVSGNSTGFHKARTAFTNLGRYEMILDELCRESRFELLFDVEGVKDAKRFLVSQIPSDVQNLQPNSFAEIWTP